MSKGSRAWIRLLLSGQSISIFCGCAVVAQLLSAPAWAKTKLKPCDSMTMDLNVIMQDASNQGYLTMTQPLAATADAANAKIQEFRSYLASVKDKVEQWQGSVGADCPALQAGKDALADGQLKLAAWLEYPGPYGSLSGALSNSPAAVNNFMSVRLPCYDDANGEKPNGLHSCAKLSADFARAIQRQYFGDAGLQKDGILGGFYKGCDLSHSAAEGCTSASSIPVCNKSPLLNAEVGWGPEVDTNHTNASCGGWHPIRVSTRGRVCAIADAAPGATADREHAYWKGANVRAYDCALAQVKNELAQGTLKLSAAQGVSPTDVYGKYISELETMRANLLASPNLKDVDSCDPSSAENQAGKVSAKQSACVVFEKRALLEADFLGMVSMELNTRARRSWERFNAGSASKGFFVEFQDYVNLHRTEMSADVHCNGKKSDCNADHVLNACIKPLFNRFFDDRAASIWSPEVCQ